MIVMEKVDEALLRGLLSAHSKTPLEALYLETNSAPIRFIFKSRRIMYLHNILQKDGSELIRKVYEAQKDNPTPGDFCELVRDDCRDIDLNMSDEEIAKHTKKQFKNLVKNKVRDGAFSYLTMLKNNHSKRQGLSYKSLKLQDYMFSPIFNTECRNLLFRLRTRTVGGIKSEFKGVYSDTTCPLGCGQNDTLPHTLGCTVLRRHHKSTDVNVSDCRYEDVLSENNRRQQSTTEI